MRFGLGGRRSDRWSLVYKGWGGRWKKWLPVFEMRGLGWVVAGISVRFVILIVLLRRGDAAASNEVARNAAGVG